MSQLVNKRFRYRALSRRLRIALSAIAHGWQAGYLAILLVLLQALLGSNAHAQCLTISSRNLNFDSVLVGAELDLGDTITNSQSDSISISSSIGNSGDTTFGVSLPPHFTIQNKSAIPFQVNFKPLQVGVFGDSLIFRPDSAGCASDVVQLTGFGLAATKDSSAFALGVSGPRVIGITSTTASTERTFFFTNGLDSSIVVSSVGFTTGSQFVGKLDRPLPVTLAPSESLAVAITYSAKSAGKEDRAQCIIVTNDDLATSAFSIHGVQLLSSGVAIVPKSETFAFDVMPNPSQGHLTLVASGLRRGSVEMFDLLGRLVTKSSISSRWNWNGVSLAGVVVPNGVYILRVTGVDQAGAAEVSSKRIVLQR